MSGYAPRARTAAREVLRPKQLVADPIQVFFNANPRENDASEFHAAMRMRVPENSLLPLPDAVANPSDAQYCAYLSVYESNQMYYRQEAELGRVDVVGIKRLESWFRRIAPPDSSASDNCCDPLLSTLF